MNTHAKDLMEYIDASPTMFHAIKNLAEILIKNGFTALAASDKFELKAGGKYFLTNNNSSLIAWQNGTSVKNGFRIIGSHSDSPTFKIKPHPEILERGHYIKLNTEVYGGAILSTWFDRPLSIAGRVVLKSDNLIQPEQKLVDFKKPMLIIPNLAIHMNREINDGYKYNKQKDTLPLIALPASETENFKPKNFLLNLLADRLKVSAEEILDFDLYLYDCQKSSFVGANEEFFSASRIDNLGMAFPSIQALIKAKPADFTQVACVFDNEEVGSSTAPGAGSPFLSDTLKRIACCENHESGFELFQQSLAKSFLISADQAHALHPNYAEKNDITNFPMMNKGPAIKNAASMSYTSDSVSSGVFRSVCEKAGVPCQVFVNRSDMRGGSTIGPITMTNLNIKSVDVGNPILSMHSVKELGGVKDQEYITKAFIEFFK
ncbi:MAG: M18 family aminopeptidase [Treponema sp.]|nr:MAG: M18 family aminopeptidase [Treponema sp.]